MDMQYVQLIHVAKRTACLLCTMYVNLTCLLAALLYLENSSENSDEVWYWRQLVHSFATVIGLCSK